LMTLPMSRAVTVLETMYVTSNTSANCQVISPSTDPGAPGRWHPACR
jgi:hypothetical protein